MKVVAYDPVPDARAGDRARRREGRARRAARPRRLHHPAHAADRPDPQHPQPRESGQDQEGRADRQLRARRADRRGGAQGRRSTAAMSPAPRSTCSSRSRPRTIPCSARPAWSRPRISAPRPPRRRSTSRSRSPSRCRDFLVRGGVTNALNMPSLSAEEAPRLRPYMALAEKLGSLVGQLAGRLIRSIEVEAEGAAAELNQKPITRRRAGRADAGLFGHGEHGQRAVPGARSAGSTCARSATTARAITTRWSRVTVDTETGRARSPAPCSATPRRASSKCSASRVEAELAGEMIYIVNEDAPGFIGRARHAARRGGGQHRHLQPRPPRGRRAKRSLWSRSMIRSRRTSPASCEPLPGVLQVVPLSF